MNEGNYDSEMFGMGAAIDCMIDSDIDEYDKSNIDTMNPKDDAAVEYLLDINDKEIQ